MIKCKDCPRCKDVYPPETVDHNGNHFCICGMSGNIVYTYPRKEKRYNGKGYIKFSEDSCGIYKTFEDAFNAMSKPEQLRWRAKNKEQISIFDIMEE